jgi:hypothetical protein
VLPPVTVFVVQPAAESGFVDAALQGRIDSTKDLTASWKCSAGASTNRAPAR